MGLSEQFASLPKTSSCESHYLLVFSSPFLGSAGLGTTAVSQAPPCHRRSWGTDAFVNQALTWVGSGRMIGIGATNLALLFADTKIKDQLFGALVSFSRLTSGQLPGKVLALSMWHNRTDAWRLN